jgi:hypothetical protein
VDQVDEIVADLQLMLSQASRYRVLSAAFASLGLFSCLVDTSGCAHHQPPGVGEDVAAWYFGRAVLSRRTQDICTWEHTGSIQEDGKRYISYMVPVRTRYGSTKGWTLITLPVGSCEALER